MEAITTNRRARHEEARVVQAGVVSAKIEVLAVRCVQACYALVGCWVTLARPAGASAWGGTVGIGGAGLQVLRTSDALFTYRRRSDDTMVERTRLGVDAAFFSSVAELAVVAVFINLALNALVPRFVAITHAYSARSAILIGRAWIAGVRPSEARLRANNRRPVQAQSRSPGTRSANATGRIDRIPAVCTGRRAADAFPVADLSSGTPQIIITLDAGYALHASAVLVAAPLRIRQTMPGIQTCDARIQSLAAMRRGPRAGMRRVLARVRALVAIIVGAKQVVIASVGKA